MATRAIGPLTAGSPLLATGCSIAQPSVSPTRETASRGAPLPPRDTGARLKVVRANNMAHPRATSREDTPWSSRVILGPLKMLLMGMAMSAKGKSTIHFFRVKIHFCRVAVRALMPCNDASPMNIHQRTKIM